jgi:hypothetical protein
MYKVCKINQICNEHQVDIQLEYESSTVLVPISVDLHLMLILAW